MFMFYRSNCLRCPHSAEQYSNTDTSEQNVPANNSGRSGRHNSFRGFQRKYSAAIDQRLLDVQYIWCPSHPKTDNYRTRLASPQRWILCGISRNSLSTRLSRKSCWRSDKNHTNFWLGIFQIKSEGVELFGAVLIQAEPPGRISIC